MQEALSPEKVDSVDVSEVNRYRTRSRILAAVSVVLGVAVIGFGAWTLFSGDDDRMLTAEQEAMFETIDEYLAAWNEGDAAAADALLDPDGYLEDISGRYYVSDGRHAAYVESMHSTGFSLERTDEAYVIANTVLVAYTGVQNSVPGLYYMSPDGTKILWVLDPFPPSFRRPATS
mgnify:CR=1 FL=1